MRTDTASKIKDTPIEWLWPRRIPIGRCTILEGDPECGKSQLTMMIAATVSRGTSWPDGTSTSMMGCTIVCNVEDPRESVQKPRAWAAGANLNLVELMDFDTSTSEPLIVPDNVPILSRMVDSFNRRVGLPPVRLIIIDPFDAPIVSEKIDLNRSGHARRALRPLELLASERRLAVVVIRHLSKTQGRNAKYRGLGSISILGAARSALTVAPDPSNPRQSILASVKGNWGKKPESWAFDCEGVTYTSEIGQTIETSRVRFIGASSATADSLAGESLLRAGELEAAIKFLSTVLKGGSQQYKVLKVKAHDEDISADALWQAKHVMSINWHHDGEDWVWELPAPEADWNPFSSAAG